MKIKSVHIVFFVSICIFLIGIFAKLNAPMVEWDYLCYLGAVDLSKLFLDHPPVYAIFLSIIFKIFGASIPVARLSNAFFILLTAFAIYRLSIKLWGKNVGLFAVSLYLLNPVIIQGSTLLGGPDATLLPLGFILLYWQINRALQAEKNNLFYILAIGFTTAVCLWLKITSTLVMIFGIFLYTLIYYRKGSIHYPKVILGLMLGVIIFTATWSAVSIPVWGKEKWFFVLSTPWHLFKYRIVLGFDYSKLAAFMLYLIRFAFWFSPFLVFLFLLQIYRLHYGIIRKNAKSFMLLIWISSFYLFAYLVVGAMSHGFPRYHIGILPLVVLAAAVLIDETISDLKSNLNYVLLGLVFVIAIIGISFFEDPLLFFNLKFKEIILAGGSIVPGIIRQVLQVLILFAIAAFGVSMFKELKIMKKIIIAIFVAMLSYNIYLDIVQAMADYITSYGYGGKGKQDLMEVISRNIQKKDVILAMPDIRYEVKEKEPPFITCSVWLSSKEILDTIRNLNPKVIVMGLNSHTLKQWKDIENPEIQSILGNKYKTRRIGTYTLWIRKQ